MASKKTDGWLAMGWLTDRNLAAMIFVYKKKEGLTMAAALRGYSLDRAQRIASTRLHRAGRPQRVHDLP